MAHTPNEKAAPVLHSHGGVDACDLLNRVASDGKSLFFVACAFGHDARTEKMRGSIPLHQHPQTKLFQRQLCVQQRCPALGTYCTPPPPLWVCLSFSLTLAVCDGGRCVVWDRGHVRAAWAYGAKDTNASEGSMSGESFITQSIREIRDSFPDLNSNLDAYWRSDFLDISYTL